MNIINTTEPVKLLDGEYQATWTGKEITLHTLDGDVICQTKDTTIRGTIELEAKIEDGIIYTKL